MKFLYALAFLLGGDNWKLEQMPNEITESLTGFDKAKTNVLDLGCGEGQECVSLASDGWNVIGVDYLSLAIRRASVKARKSGVSKRTNFVIGDVSNLSALNLPPIHFAYDIGCFHLLNPDQAEGYISGLSDAVVQGGLFLLNAFTPRRQGKKMVGYDTQTVEELFNMNFRLEQSNNRSYWRFPAGWYWFRRL